MEPAILVTGGAGYIGSVTVERLLEAGRRVVVLDDLSKGHRSAIPRDVPLVVGSVGDVEAVGRRPLPTPTAAPITSIGDVSADDAGRTLTVEGVLGKMEALSAGVRFPLSDESGEIVLWLWQNVYEAFPEAGRLEAGVRVRVTGEIEVYEDTLEIVPEVEGILIID